MPLASTSPAGALPGFDEAFALSVEWPPHITEYLLQAQRTQLQIWLGWQESLVAMQRELWDLWACRWAGGAPIDA